MKATIGDTSDLEMRVDALTRELTAQFSRAGRRLKAMSPLETVGDRKSAAASIQTNIQRAVATRLQQKSMTFRKAQRRYMAEVNKRKTASSFGSLLGPGAAGGGAADADDVDTVSGSRRAPGGRLSGCPSRGGKGDRPAWRHRVPAVIRAPPPFPRRG